MLVAAAAVQDAAVAALLLQVAVVDVALHLPLVVAAAAIF